MSGIEKWESFTHTFPIEINKHDIGKEIGLHIRTKQVEEKVKQAQQDTHIHTYTALTH